MLEPKGRREGEKETHHTDSAHIKSLIGGQMVRGDRKKGV